MPKQRREEYGATEAALLAVLSEAKSPLPFEELVGEVRKRVPERLFPSGQRLSWYVKSVQLELEAIGRVERVAGVPLRWRLPTGAMRSIHQAYHVKATPAQVWRMLVDPSAIEEWSGTPAVMSSKPGSRFSLWGGDIHGENVEVTPEKRLVQRWQERGWKQPSIVTFTISRGGPGETVVELDQTNIPSDRVEDIAHGWDEYYLGVIKQSFR
jgi:uncharacterized protein YndB with AHSA1/START domain